MNNEADNIYSYFHFFLNVEPLFVFIVIIITITIISIFYCYTIITIIITQASSQNLKEYLRTS